MNQLFRMSRYLFSLVSWGKDGSKIASESLQGEDQIGKGLVLAVGCLVEAMILKGLLYRTGRLWDFDQYLYEERRCREQQIRDELPESGWVEKTVEYLLRDLMPGASEHAIRIHLNSLVRKGFLFERENPAYPWEHALQYRVNFIRLQKAMAVREYPLGESIFEKAAEMDIKPMGCSLQDNEQDIKEVQE